jgi:hypothetical protein
MLHIFASFNEVDQRGRVDLSTVGSLEDIRRWGSSITVSAKVVLFDPYEFEVQGVLDFDKDAGIWVASPIWSTVRHYDQESDEEIHPNSKTDRPETPRISSSLSEVDRRGRARPTSLESRADIIKYEGHLRIGHMIILYSPGEFEVRVVSDYEENNDCWLASPLWSTMERFARDTRSTKD